MYKVNNKDTRKKDVIDVALMPFLLTLNIFTPFSSVSIVHFEQVNVCLESCV